MKLVMTLLTRDEEDVIEANLVYHLERGVDFFVVADNGSEDGTLEVLEAYASDGLVHIIRDPSSSADYRRWRPELARLATTDFGADWVINNDADEFWWSDRGTLRDVLEEIPPEHGVLLAPRANFLPPPDAEGAGFFAARATVREVRSRKGTFSGNLPLPPKAVHRAHVQTLVQKGAHSATVPGLATAVGWHPLTVMHFPIRSYSQWERKVIQTAAAKLEAGVDSRHYGERQGRVAAGGLREEYESLAASRESAERGVAEGRLIVDRRLERFFAERPQALRLPALAGIGPGGPAPVSEWVERLDPGTIAAERSARMHGAIVEHRHAVARARGKQRRRLERAREERRTAGRRAKRAEGGARAMERSRLGRLGRGLAGLRSRVSRLG